jgi:hypothetical protein
MVRKTGRLGDKCNLGIVLVGCVPINLTVDGYVGIQSIRDKDGGLQRMLLFRKLSK